MTWHDEDSTTPCVCVDVCGCVCVCVCVCVFVCLFLFTVFLSRGCSYAHAQNRLLLWGVVSLPRLLAESINRYQNVLYSGVRKRLSAGWHDSFYLYFQGDIATCAGTYLHVWSVNGQLIVKDNTSLRSTNHIQCCVMSEVRVQRSILGLP